MLVAHHELIMPSDHVLTYTRCTSIDAVLD